MKINKIDSSKSDNEISKPHDESFEAYFKKVSIELKKGQGVRGNSIQDCVGSWIEKADFSRYNN